ncbi:MAG: UDP-2,4-diacetamido-2,4,6-trideoxy-beta-L-altropyranose hydrolase [Candidatus Margulisbacteria bacterium]|nr:UDP-2,4-diacetamido-2,4,6-trideoxy-beta-L-altropyranose hydrolase [Candidatus Margulisiibacteriota bacterium]MBU1617126.1 UDP-2,4-diacetamido-2,4,6-trideoxy-beta-L-altropyranose hydrolase [Candidatus Margulisiibacteriota bacterium]
MKVFFRVDASKNIGIGHLMRCLTLATALVEKGVKVSFICRELQGEVHGVVESKGIKVHKLPGKSAGALAAGGEETKNIMSNETSGPDWLVVDNYALDENWESQMRPYVKNIMVIDDLADRSHNCDVLLDQNYFENLENRYDGLVPVGCAKYLGPKYALLRKEFLAVERKSPGQSDLVGRVLISFGGADPTNETVKSLNALMKLEGFSPAIDVVIGVLNPNKKAIEQLCANFPGAVVHYQVNNIAQIMAKADIAIGSGGATTWERCYLGLPTITLVLAENQAKIATDLAAQNVIVNMGWHANVTSDGLALAIKNLVSDSGKRRKMSAKGRLLVDGKGVERMISVMLERR